MILRERQMRHDDNDKRSIRRDGYTLTNRAFAILARNHVGVRKRSAIHSKRFAVVSQSPRAGSACLDVGFDIDALRP